MRWLVFVEQRHGRATAGSLGVLAKVRSLAGDGTVGAVVAGTGDLKELAAVAGRHGADRVHLAEHDGLDPPLPQPHVEVIEAVVASGQYDVVLFSNSVLGADVAAGAAARLGAGINWDLVELEVRDGRLVGQQLAFADSVLVDAGWRSEVAVGLVRAGVFPAAPVDGSSGDPELIDVAVAPSDWSAAARVVEQRPVADEGPALETAEVVVSGGMGLGGAEHVALAEELASVLGGVPGATRAAVYAGWYPHSAQIGQTGKSVAPKLYVALGVSGAIQHKVGMQRSQVVIAVNTDPAAPIFEFSDLAVVGDVHVVVPRLVELLRQRGGG